MDSTKFKNRWLRQLLDSVHIGILVVDKNRNNLFANRCLCDMFGYEEEEILRTNSRIFHTSQESYQNFGKKDFLSAMYNGSVKLDHQFKRKDGTIFWAHISADLVAEHSEILWTVVDITKRKNLEISYYRQAQLVEQIQDGIVTIDLNGICTSWNRGAEKIVGYKAEEVIGKSTEMLYLHKDIKTLKDNLKFFMKVGTIREERDFIAKDKSIVHTELTGSLLKDIDGNPIGMIGYFKDISERKKAREKLEYQASHDTLTKLANRALFYDRLEQGVKKAKRNRSILAVLFIDLDHFKEINDSLGHEIGDDVLIGVTQRLNSVMRGGDSLARLGGDEFTVILENISKPQDVSMFAKKILDSLQEPLLIKGHTLYVSCSIGISLYPNDTLCTQDLLKFSDSAMYKAKSEGRNNFQYYSSEMTELAFERVVMETSLRQAVANKEFVVYYQPQVDGATGEIVGMEALVRWKHPVMGLVPPNNFIPLAESTGLILEIDDFVMQSALEQFNKWRQEGLNPGRLSLNLTAGRLKSKKFLEKLKKIMQEPKNSSVDLELEVTESQIMEKPQEAIEILKEISALGIKIAVDDFGTGYSSLSYLKRLPIDKLKIDQSFVKDLPHDEEDGAITIAIIALAKSLKLEIIAEGIEKEEQRDFVVKQGCKKIQGYFYSRPICAEKMRELLRAS